MAFGFGKKKLDDVEKMEKDFTYGEESKSKASSGSKKNKSDGDDGYGGAANEEDAQTDSYGYGESPSKVRTIKEEDTDSGFYLKPWELGVVIIEIILFIYTLLVLLNVVPLI